MTPEPEAPRATYRVQLNRNFTFDDLIAQLDLLVDLGVSHVYCSPYLQAAPGSTHGYDVVDHRSINRELGGEQAHHRFVDALKVHGLGQVLDIVPNHMVIRGRENRWWWDVLEHGRASRYASFFDIDWEPPEAKLHDTILLPVLGDHYGRVLEQGELKLERDVEGVVVRYGDDVFPINESSVNGKDIDQVNRDPDELDAVLQQQNYRLAFWKTAGHELDYRRFFDIDSLVALRVEENAVFDETHGKILGMIEEGSLDGLRIDHPDGLADPKGYLDRLDSRAPGTWIVVEKILESGEVLPPDWPVEGTTGYDFMQLCNGLFVDAASEEKMTEIYHGFIGSDVSYDEVVHASKQQVMRGALATDVARLADLFARICEQHRRFRDYTRHDIHDAIRELIAAFPVYRTYVRPRDEAITETDRWIISQAASSAWARRPEIDDDLLGFLTSVLTLRTTGDLETQFVVRFQQATGPVMAKGVEDTAFYNYNRLISLNEVGGDPASFGTSVETFHEAMRARAEGVSSSMLATSTHDTKRSEDVRARIDVLSEMADRWGSAVTRWRDMNAAHKVDGMPDANIEYLLYQTLVGAYPLDRERALAYIQKASKEAKAATSWTAPDEEYDRALEAFVEAIMQSEAFMAELDAFVPAVITAGRINSLAQTLLKLTCPGVPDIYQGTELWDLSLVDPDNRRPVDHGRRRQILAQVLNHPSPPSLDDDDGAAKLFVIAKTLRHRSEQPQSLAGSYEAAAVDGGERHHVVAFSRSEGASVVVVPRLVLDLTDWGSTVVMLPEGQYRDIFTGDVWAGDVEVGKLLAGFPVALLARESA